MIVGKRFAICSGAKNICISLTRHRNYRQVLNLRSRYRRKTKNRLPQKNLPPYCVTGKQLPPYCITAEKRPPYLGLPLPPNSLPPKNEKSPTAKKNYRRIALPPKNYRHILVYRFRQSRYRQKRENRQPPKNYRRMAIPPRLCPPKRPLPTTTLKISDEKKKTSKKIPFING